MFCEIPLDQFQRASIFKVRCESISLDSSSDVPLQTIQDPIEESIYLREGAYAPNGVCAYS